MSKKIGILGVPLGYAGARRGAELGTVAIRNARVHGASLVSSIERLGFTVVDRGDIDVPEPKEVDVHGNAPRFLSEISGVSSRSAEAVYSMLRADETPILLGGDHAIAIGTFSGLSRFFRERGEPLGLIWFDAHADINSPQTTPSGNIHGMPLAALLGEGEESLTGIGGYVPKLEKNAFVHIGARDVDPGERSVIEKLGVRDRFLTMSDIDRCGMVDCMRKAIELASDFGKRRFAVTFDVDVADPRFAPGSGTLARGGITYREAHLCLEMIAESGMMASFEIVEVNPLLDEKNITVELAAELILSSLGKSII